MPDQITTCARSDRTVYLEGMARAQVAMELLFDRSKCSIAADFLDRLTKQDHSTRHLFLAGFVNGLVREVLVRDFEVQILRAQLSQGGAEHDEPH